MSICMYVKAHTNFTSILIEAQSQEEFVTCILALSKHACDKRGWEGGKCDFHPLQVCTCNKCDDKEESTCQGKPDKIGTALTCKFHALVYEIEYYERASQVEKLVHPILKRGHSNAVEASHKEKERKKKEAIAIKEITNWLAPYAYVWQGISNTAHIMQCSKPCPVWQAVAHIWSCPVRQAMSSVAHIILPSEAGCVQCETVNLACQVWQHVWVGIFPVSSSPHLGGSLLMNFLTTISSIYS